MRLSIAVSFLFVVTHLEVTCAHPIYLRCNGLSQSIASGGSILIMGFSPEKVQANKAGYDLVKLQSEQSTTNYSIVLKKGYEDNEFVIQATDNSTALLNYGNGTCGNDPNHKGHGLCSKCSTQLFAMSYDCTGTMKCVFGVTGTKPTVLIGWTDGGQLFYTETNL